MDNKEKIMQCALELFSNKGYEGTGIQEITQVAGITKPTLYYYFGNKEGLLNTIFEYHFSDFIKRIETAASYSGDTVKGVTEISRQFLTIAKENPIFYRMHLSMSSSAVNTTSFLTITPYCERIEEIVETFFLKAAQDNGNMKGHEREISRSYLGVINSYTLLLLNGKIELSEELIYRIVHLFLHGIYS
ncbi:MAG: TetR/AcrR family transcriptional regulator [Spirochaetales bacterium]|nr:TetR/AcrR family transcriptional regulator [Spirochaetales bacterium]